MPAKYISVRCELAGRWLGSLRSLVVELGLHALPRTRLLGRRLIEPLAVEVMLAGAVCGHVRIHRALFAKKAEEPIDEAHASTLPPRYRVAGNT